MNENLAAGARSRNGHDEGEVAGGNDQAAGKDRAQRGPRAERHEAEDVQRQCEITKGDRLDIGESDGVVRFDAEDPGAELGCGREDDPDCEKGRPEEEGRPGGRG